MINRHSESGTFIGLSLIPRFFFIGNMGFGPNIQLINVLKRNIPNFHSRFEYSRLDVALVNG